jgi:hypothetical protein
MKPLCVGWLFQVAFAVFQLLMHSASMVLFLLFLTLKRTQTKNTPSFRQTFFVIFSALCLFQLFKLLRCERMSESAANESLLIAAQGGDLDAAKAAVSNGAKINCTDGVR